MGEARCRHGFLRSVVPCAACEADETARWKARALAAEGRVRVTRQWVANLVERLDEVIGQLPEGGEHG